MLANFVSVLSISNHTTTFENRVTMPILHFFCCPCLQVYFLIILLTGSLGLISTEHLWQKNRLGHGGASAIFSH